jgi:RND family efflux transporter MFP subunit
LFLHQFKVPSIMHLYRASAPVIAAFLLAFASVSPSFAQGGPSLVVTERVEMRTLAETRPIFGEVVAQRDSAIAARVAGIVDEVRVLVGDQVEPGDVLAVLDRQLIDIELDQAEASVAESEAGIAVAEARVIRTQDVFNRTDALRGSSAFSEGRLEDTRGAFSEARGQLAEAQARLLNAQAALERARYNFERAEITAPFRGIVLSVETDPGQFISAGEPVARLLDVTTLEIEANVPAQYIEGLSPELVLSGETEEGTPLDLTVRAILPTEFAATRTRPVRFTTDLQALTRRVAVGQSITVSVPTDAPRDALSVPKDALTQSASGWSVFVDEEGVAAPRTVQIGVAMGDRFEVLGGLNEGDVVVVRGNERLFPGQPIQATN